MISFVRGSVAQIGASAVVLDVGGVGMALQCTPRTTAALRTGQEVTLAASLVVREDSMTLFGFADEAELAVFELLQTASGVGPRLALAVLAVHSPDRVRAAIAGEDLAALTAVPGIGRKGAQRIVLELKDKVGPLTAAVTSGETPTPAAPVSGWQQQVHEALVALGWSARDAERAVAAVAKDAAATAGPDQIPQLLRAALQTLART